MISKEKSYNHIKELIYKYEITKNIKNASINHIELDTYYQIGKELKEAGKNHGEKVLIEYAEKLENEFNKKYSRSSLIRYRQFYDIIQNGATVSHLLTWSHYQEVLPLNSIEEINFYINKTITNTLSVRNLRKIIKSNEFQRLPKNTRNKLINKEILNIFDETMDPIIVKVNDEIQSISEEYLKQMILENISDFMNQLGEGYSFVNSEYPIRMCNTKNYIDILLFNIKYNCYVVVELKVIELKKDHIGQIQVYMNYIDDNIKKITHDKTIGLIVVKRNNKYIIKYSSDKRIKAVEWTI